MTECLDIVFDSLKAKPEPTVALLVGKDLSFSAQGEEMDEKCNGSLTSSAEAADFKGKKKSSVEVLAPRGLASNRVLLIGTGKPSEASEIDWTNLGGYACGLISQRNGTSASLIAEADGVEGANKAAEVAAILAFGAHLRHYKFSKYKTKKSKAGEKEDDTNGKDDSSSRLKKLVVHCADPKKAEAAFADYRAIANGVCLARDLVNEPANTLGPVEFAEQAKALEEFGLEVDILDEDDLKKHKMNALLAVGQGSARPSRVAVMQWWGAKSKKSKPLAFVGKGVVFDTGGISIKPAAGMEDMKGDMGGAACVTGLMRTLAERNAPVNAIGIIGCVENMPSSNAQRPGDIVTSMSGQTIEVLNTDAEGRLVLADAVWYAQQQFKPKFIIDLATLTGAIMIALGKDHAGVFSNDDKLFDQLAKASKVTGEKIWRMPLDDSFDRLIDSKNADVKNLGGRWAGACTAAHFIKRFVDDTPWVHIDLAGPAMGAANSDINQSWGPGWGVRLLNRLVADNFEK